MAQSDQVVQNATFPSVRADINDNLAALYSQSSGNSAPTVTVAFQPWVDTSSSPPVWKVRNGSNSAWITVGILDPAGFNAGGITAIANGGTGATTAALALAALLPSQGGNAGKALVTSGSAASWGTVASGASIQVFTASGTYTPTTGKSTFLAVVTGGGGGGGGSDLEGEGGRGGGTGGGGGTGFRLYTSTEMGSTAAITFGSGGAGGPHSESGSTAGGNGSTSQVDPSGTGLTLAGYGGGGGSAGANGGGGGSNNSYFSIPGYGGGGTFWTSGPGAGGGGAPGWPQDGSTGSAGTVFILEW